MEAQCSSETLVYSQKTTQRNNPKDHRLQNVRNFYKFFIEKPKGRGHLEEYVVDGKIILEYVLGKYDVIMRMVGFSGDGK
jgi:hypothetical protein